MLVLGDAVVVGCGDTLVVGFGDALVSTGGTTLVGAVEGVGLTVALVLPDDGSTTAKVTIIAMTTTKDATIATMFSVGVLLSDSFVLWGSGGSSMIGCSSVTCSALVFVREQKTVPSDFVVCSKMLFSSRRWYTDTAWLLGTYDDISVSTSDTLVGFCSSKP